MKHWVMDYETLSNCFVGVFEHYKTQETKVFVIHELQNDLEKFIEFFQEKRDAFASLSLGGFNTPLLNNI